MLAQSTTLVEFYYTKGDLDTSLADKVFNIGDISLPGLLDICTSAHTNSKIRRNAEVGGYTGYAELKAASSYDMFVNPSTTRTDGGWMYLKLIMTTIYNSQVAITKLIVIKTQQLVEI